MNQRPIPLYVLLLVVALVATIAWGLKMMNDEQGEDRLDDVKEQLGG